MARWEPDAPKRLSKAALELFAERGYENTTVVDIAARAGLTKSTFFRHFQDKREVLFGGSALADLLAEAVVAAPPAATPVEAVICAMDAAAREAFTPELREFSAQRRSVIAAHPELQERDALKGLAIIAAMTDALRRRGVAELTARVVAELGALAMKIGYERWIEGDAGDFGEAARRALDEVQAAVAR
ncbi:TetR/AcrR family transcriptional regulator [Amycolatopsis rifamycinica]|uniref:TetR family transcriptional regulator n=1 Tax=Amycolatopsis rifamycinica TaxID=287986 RepID=A0A066U8F3_9PSEU|nr:TetR/AcrR family transcriptional regulator [Amycolatopsis rifamycinica]KDN20399.1 TetR family transcriptional regulator [Amycolatopsis rifamycinica]